MNRIDGLIQPMPPSQRPVRFLCCSSGFIPSRKPRRNARVERAMTRTASAAVRSLPPDVPAILLVEASALTRMALAAYLRECGYEVLETNGPSGARRALQAGAKADIAFIGLDGAGQTEGFGLAQWIRGNRPDVRVLLTSGVRRAAETAGELCEQGPHLAKPYEHRQLEAQIRRLLAR